MTMIISKCAADKKHRVLVVKNCFTTAAGNWVQHVRNTYKFKQVTK